MPGICDQASLSTICDTKTCNQITYPGMNNYSSFVYDGYGSNVSIVETVSGSVTSTKQFVWNSIDRCEERDGSGTVTKQFFDPGQINSATKYFYVTDHLGSIREMTDNTGGVQAEYTFDPFGQIAKISEIITADFGYAGYYLHSRSSLNLTRTRAYSGVEGRFINRDPILESGGSNLYAYVRNNPTIFTDPEGTVMTGSSSSTAVMTGINSSAGMGPLQPKVKTRQDRENDCIACCWRLYDKCYENYIKLGYSSASAIKHCYEETFIPCALGCIEDPCSCKDPEEPAKKPAPRPGESGGIGRSFGPPPPPPNEYDQDRKTAKPIKSGGSGGGGSW